MQTSGGAPDIVPTVEFLVSLAREFPQCGYVKEEHAPVQERMLALAEHRPNPIKTILGANFGRAWVYEMRLGTDGVMTGGVMYADIYAGMWDLHQQGRHDEVRDLNGKLLQMLNLDNLIPGVRLYVLRKRACSRRSCHAAASTASTQHKSTRSSIGSPRWSHTSGRETNLGCCPGFRPQTSGFRRSCLGTFGLVDPS